MTEDNHIFNRIFGESFFNKDGNQQDTPFHLRKKAINHVDNCKCDVCQLERLRNDPNNIPFKWGFI